MHQAHELAVKAEFLVGCHVGGHDQHPDSDLQVHVNEMFGTDSQDSGQGSDTDSGEYCILENINLKPMVPTPELGGDASKSLDTDVGNQASSMDSNAAVSRSVEQGNMQNRSQPENQPQGKSILQDSLIEPCSQHAQHTSMHIQHVRAI